VKRLLSGNEAVAREPGRRASRSPAAYPGTPSTEILENLARYPTSMPSGRPTKRSPWTWRWAQPMPDGGRWRP